MVLYSSFDNIDLYPFSRSDFGNTSSITAVETSRVVRSKTLMTSTQVDSSQTAVPQEMSFATSTQNLSPTQQSNIGSMLPPAISLAKSSFWDADESGKNDISKLCLFFYRDSKKHLGIILNTVNIRKPDRLVFEWSFSGHFLCPVF